MYIILDAKPSPVAKSQVHSIDGRNHITNKSIWPVINQIRQSRVTKNSCSSPTDICHNPMRDCSSSYLERVRVPL